MHEGFQNVISGGESYRVLVHRLSPTQLVAIGQQLDVRDEISFESALRTLIPLSLLLPILLLVATDLIRKAFRPVSLLADEVHQRDERNLTPFLKMPFLMKFVHLWVVSINCCTKLTMPCRHSHVLSPMRPMSYVPR